MIKWKRTGSSGLQAQDGTFRIVLSDSGWMLLQADEDSFGGWCWCQTFATQREAKASAEAIIAEATTEVRYFDLLDPSTHHIAFE